MPDPYPPPHKCAKPDCPRQVSPASSFCCGNCAGANGGLYELDPYQDDPVRDPYSMHTAACQARHDERGPWQDPHLPPPAGTIVRPWAHLGDNWEIIIPAPPDLQLPALTREEQLAAYFRYIQTRYGGLPQWIGPDWAPHDGP